MRASRWMVVVCAPIAASGCGDDESGGAPPPTTAACTVGTSTGCAVGTVCEEVQDAAPACFAPLTVKGRVVDALTQAGIAGARVVARDPNDAALSRVAVSAADGAYALVVPAKRDAAGKPVAAAITLRSDAQGYLGFPKAPRVALPIDLATASSDPPEVTSAATTVALLPLADSEALGWISGRVLADEAGGTLVVAGAATGLADLDGNYVVFNVPAGDVTVAGYGAGLELAEVTAKVVAGKEAAGIDLALLGPASAVVSGKVSLVNPGEGKVTSVILVVESTFDETAARGEAPKGLRAGSVDGAFEIAGVPSGRYVALAAFENDLLVRDPDTSIGGTDLVHVEVTGASVEIAESFKVTGALGVVSPGKDALDVVGTTPTFTWEDDSSEDHYELRVFDAFGASIWEKLDVPGVSGSATAAAAYGGPPLEAGMIYQFRATSIGKAGGNKPAAPISQTEDLRGVFEVQ